MKVQDSTSLEADLAFTDETKAEVIPSTGAVAGPEGQMGEKIQHWVSSLYSIVTHFSDDG